jgi:hypothetical protein
VSKWEHTQTIAGGSAADYASAMKWVMVAMGAILLLAGCGGVKPSSTPSPTASTYTDGAYDYSVTFDPRLFRQLPEAPDVPKYLLLGLYLQGKREATLSADAQFIGAQEVSRLLSVWGRGKVGRYIGPTTNPWGGDLKGVSKASWVTVGRLRGVRLDLKGLNPRTEYEFASGQDLYWITVSLADGANQTKQAPLLDRVIESFRVTK